MGQQTMALKKLGRNLWQLALAGQLTGKQVRLNVGRGVVGPRAGVLTFSAGLATGDVLSALTKNDMATLRQIVPWPFPGSPNVSMRGREIAIEAGWPSEWARSLVRLGELNTRAIRAGAAWAAGLAETGQTVSLTLDDTRPSFLIAGQTGSGKSVSLRSAVYQLAQRAGIQLVLCDGKFGESLHVVSRLPGVVGPLATTGPQITAALGWVAAQMRRRLEAGKHQGQIVLAYDEFQRHIGDQVISGLLNDIVTLGRAASVCCLLSTQHPSLKVFANDTTRRNLVGRIALRVGDLDASRVAIGDTTPRADYLLGCGDSYSITPEACIRTQAVYTDQADYDTLSGGAWQFDEWPDFDPAGVIEKPETVNWSYTGDELAAAIISADQGDGRPAMLNRLEAIGLGRPGAERAIRLLTLGRETLSGLKRQSYNLARLLAD